MSAPLLLEALQGPSIPAALAGEPAEPRFLTPAQQAAVDAAFNSTMTKGKVGGPGNSTASRRLLARSR